MRTARLVAVTALGSALTAWLVGVGVGQVAGYRYAPWVLGRAAGITSYLLLVLLVITGLVLSHPRRERWRRPNAATRIRIHATLACLTLAFTLAHVVVLARDEYAHVGWAGALLPLGSDYRTVPVTLGVLGLYGGLLAGVTAALAGRVDREIWWPIHRVSSVVLVLIWVHSVLTGIDTDTLLLPLYLPTALLVLALAAWRYLAATPKNPANPKNPKNPRSPGNPVPLPASVQARRRQVPQHGRTRR